MSYLTPPGSGRAARAVPPGPVAWPGPAGPAARTGARPRLGVPGFAHPLLAPAEWGELLRPGTALDWAVLGGAAMAAVPGGPTGGPGSRPDPYVLDAAARLRDAGVRFLGHLDLARGRRPFAELIAEAQHHLSWYRVDGFALDRAPVGPAALPGTRRTAAALRTLLPGAYVLLVHGSHPAPGYAALADQLVTFCGPWAAHRLVRPPEWTAGHPPERFCHLVHGVPRHGLDEVLRTARGRGAGTLFVTDRTGADGAVPWEVLPGYWDEIVSRTGPGVSE
ncbi:spherulation-specific family 4 protein [Streptomyces gamaensis]|uniref:Spherulation-specific family 4 protein n=1 Tax=Streptomyces gamaensis TaxID=1763542 RepID=A0ABW0YTP7_9ACTN